jgi:hypothetical protein
MKQEETESIGMQVEINVGNTRIYSTYIPLQARSYGGGGGGGAGGAQPPLKAVTAPPPWKNWDITTTYFQKHIFYPSKN